MRCFQWQPTFHMAAARARVQSAPAELLKHCIKKERQEGRKTRSKTWRSKSCKSRCWNGNNLAGRWLLIWVAQINSIATLPAFQQEAAQRNEALIQEASTLYESGQRMPETCGSWQARGHQTVQEKAELKVRGRRALKQVIFSVLCWLD